MAWEVSKRWRSLPAGDIFAPSVRYQLPASTVADLTGVDLQAARVGIAPQSTCAAGTDAAAAGVLDARGCQALLRATYTDESATYVLTVGVAVLPSAAQASAAQAAIAAGAGGYLDPGVHAVPFARYPGWLLRRRAAPDLPQPQRPGRTSSCTPPGTRTAGPGSRSARTGTPRAR